MSQLDPDLARIAHLAVALDELRERISSLYAPASEALWARARPGARQLAQELTVSLGNSQQGSGSIAALIVAADIVLSGDQSA